MINNDDGSEGNDTLTGDKATNALSGLGGDDTIRGYAGNDVITGGAGIDLLFGGVGEDRFVFAAANDSGTVKDTLDRINDFVSGKDMIDLSGIDADPATLAEDAFAYRGSLKFTGAGGEVRVNISGDNATVRLDIDGDKDSDMTIFVRGGASLVETDFVL